MSASFLQRMRLFGPGQLVFVQLQAAILGTGAHGDVVVLAAGEIVEGEGKLLVADDAQVGVHRDRRAVPAR